MTSPLGAALEDPAFLADPYPRLAGLRDLGPLPFDDRLGVRLAASYADAAEVLRSRDLGRTGTCCGPGRGRSGSSSNRASEWPPSLARPTGTRRGWPSPMCATGADGPAPLLRGGRHSASCSAGPPEPRVALTALLRRWPRLALVSTARRPTFVLRGWSQVRVRPVAS